MTTLKEVMEHLKHGYWGVRLFDDDTAKELSMKTADAILNYGKLDRFEAVRISFNDLTMTYDIRIKAIKGADDNGN